MRVVVTGASGHVGSNLVRRLLRDGHTVRVLDYEDSPTLANLPIERVTGDVREKADLLRAFDGREVVYHAAGIVTLDDAMDPRMWAVNVDGTRNAAEAALACGVDRFVHVSSVHAYDHYRLGRPLDETCPQVASARHSPYSRAKAAGERELREVVERGLDAVIINPTAIFGPHDHVPSELGRMLLKLYARSVPALTRGGFDFVDVRDVADGAVAAAERGRTGENYLLGGHFTPVVALARVAAAVTGVPAPRLTVPISAARAFVPVVRLISRITGWRRWVTHDSLDTVDSQIDVDCSKARRELGYSPRPLEQTVRDSYAWWAEVGMLRRPEALLARLSQQSPQKTQGA